jgi:uncharacterized protein (DUF983 family)
MAQPHRSPPDGDLAQITAGTALARGARGRCPACGRGRLFRSYLKQVEACDVCGESYAHIHPDDAAPWFTMLLVGLALVPVFLIVEGFLHDHFVLTILFLVAFILAVSLAALPPVKGTLIAAFWYWTSREG